MKWIKTSERLPDKEDNYFCYQDDIHKVLCGFSFKYGFTGTYITHWLDESEEEIINKLNVNCNICKNRANTILCPSCQDPTYPNYEPEEITDTQRLDWIEQEFSLSYFKEHYNRSENSKSLRKFIDTQIQEEK